jgi:hypothetical protein
MYESIRAVVGFLAVAFLVAPLNSDVIPLWVGVSLTIALVLCWFLLAQIECSHRPRKALNQFQEAAARLASTPRSTDLPEILNTLTAWSRE